MGLVVNSNTTAMNALGNLNVRPRTDGTFAKISSGLRINSAADDSAGMAVAEFRCKRGLGTSETKHPRRHWLVQTAEGATDER